MEGGNSRKKGGSMRQSKANARRKHGSVVKIGNIERELAVRPPNGVSSGTNGIASTMRHDESSESSDGMMTPSPTSSRTEVNGNALPDQAVSHSSLRAKMERKASSPMAPTFMVSAPGKVIVFGEHAVVHGKRAMAAAISLRSYLLVTSLSKSHRTITLNFRDIGLDHTWDIDALPWDLFRHPSKKKFYYDLVTSLDPDLLEAMKPHIAEVSSDKPDDVRKIHQSSATAFLYLFLSLSSPQTHAAIYTLRSTIPIGAGLGSSASISVCLSSALLLQIRILAGPHQDQPPDEAELQIERINRWAFVSEMCIHGNPSGVDNTVSAGGKAVIFRRGDYSKPPTVEPILNFPELPLLLVNSRQPRSTATEVAKVGILKKKHSAVAASILDTIDQVTASAHDTINSEDFDKDSPESLDHFGELLRINHGLLVSLGVSHPRLERIRELVDHLGVGWTKLTGAGGGGCAITLLRADNDPKEVQELEQRLDEEGFELYRTTLGGDGVGVLWPAVLKNGSDEEGGEEIDQRKFENAIGNDGIEQLVGVGTKEKREGWKFWRRGVSVY
ncbi:mevalonate kinase [Polytolypa hystricis UAMH7299]|uniref:Mevalonate kinase n=1 Tax=Polytolypa hystricis (strain UAMH7299) TaxID=1447883 RepID=A0A2B7YAV6_POLH7|nr:mevalonate kinase [Polytolypa hystricis UAMH7299]